MKCCVIGHREILNKDDIKKRVENTVKKLIPENGVNVFLFGSNSEFNKLCYEVVSEIKKVIPRINRVFVRAEYPNVNKAYIDSLNKLYEDSYYYDQDKEYSGRCSYINRNYHIIDSADYCLFYCNLEYTPKTKTKSGTILAYKYALRKNKKIINVFIDN